MQQEIIRFFTQILQNDGKVLERISLFEGSMSFDRESGNLMFKLSDLHELLQENIKVDYPAFRKLIYQSNLNEELNKLGGRIEIHHSAGKVDDNIYRLVKTGSH
ncbi:hypothetical protein [Kaarinaea lacus]